MARCEASTKSFWRISTAAATAPMNATIAAISRMSFRACTNELVDTAATRPREATGTCAMTCPTRPELTALAIWWELWAREVPASPEVTPLRI